MAGHSGIHSGRLARILGCVLKTVRVGRFTVDDVTCVVLQKGLPNAPLILGGSFLNHFIVKLDPASNELHLTQVNDEPQAKTAHRLIRDSAAGEGDKTDRP